MTEYTDEEIVNLIKSYQVALKNSEYVFANMMRGHVAPINHLNLARLYNAEQLQEALDLRNAKDAEICN